MCGYFKGDRMIDYVAHAEIVKPQGGFWAQGKSREEKRSYIFKGWFTSVNLLWLLLITTGQAEVRKGKQQTAAWTDENIRGGVKHCLHGAKYTLQSIILHSS